jgi:hypothetical protein
MGWVLGGGILYLVLIVTLGLLTVRKGHWAMFLFGLVLPVFWVIGAIMRPVRRVR